MKLLVILTLFSLYTLSSCAYYQPYYYQPNSLNIPTVKKQGELELKGSLGYISSYEFEGAYAPYKRYLLAANYLRNRPLSSGSQTAADYHFGEMGAGAFVVGGDNMMNVTGWLGFGKVGNQYAPQTRSELHFNRYALQLGLARHTSDYRVDAGFRFGLIHFTRGEIGVEAPAQHLQYIHQIEKQKNIPFAAAGISLATGWRHMKLYLQVEHEISGINLDEYVEGYFSSRIHYFLKGRAGLGVQIFLNTKHKKSTPDPAQTLTRGF